MLERKILAFCVRVVTHVSTWYEDWKNRGRPIGQINYNIVYNIILHRPREFREICSSVCRK